MKSKDLKLIIFLELLAVVLVVVIGFSGLIFGIPFPDLTSNPLSRLGLPFYQGVMQRLGLLIWACAAVLPLFTLFALWSVNNINEIKWYLLLSGIFFGYFVFDELLLIHNFIFPRVFHVHQLLVLIIYMIITVLFLIRFRKTLKGNYFFIFLTALAFLGMSMLIDILSYLKVVQFSFRYLLDDSIKFLGIFNLLIYYFLFCKKVIVENVGTN